ncbi:MAG: hypothetical protein QXI16_04500, partial [Sulfolobaceae archaeon]
YKNEVFILNNAGKEIKVFSLDGDFHSSFKIEKAWISDSIAVNERLIITDTRYASGNNYNSLRLISMFDHKGKKLEEIGKIIKCASMIGYLNFNQAYLALKKDQIFGAFDNRPILFSYKKDGTEIIFKDLEKDGFEEIIIKAKKERDENFDTPETIKSDNNLRYLNYCSGFSVDKGLNVYYAINIYYENSNRPYSLIYVFNKKFQLKKKLLPKYMNNTVTIKSILIDHKNSRFIIAQTERGLVLFKFK